ncbi:uncharacterized protein DMENIID0001_147700 [Sergentomyia squamirostris]
MEWTVICRICLQGDKMTSIFSEFNETGVPICDIIMKCSPLEIREEQDMPEQICSQCLKELNVAHRFWTNAESSHAILQNMLSTTEGGDSEEYEYQIDPIVKQEPDDLVDDSVLVEADDEEILLEQSENSNELELENLMEVEGENMPEDDAHIFEAAKRAAWGDDADAHQEEIENLEHGIVMQAGYKPVRQVSSVRKRMQEESRGQILTIDGKHRIEKISKKVEADGTTKAVISIRAATKVKAPKTCEICGNTYKYQHALDGHMRRHRNEKPFACDVCGRAFVIPFELRRHMRIHTGAKPYACKYCDRRFSDFGSRIKHERTHTGERPYACTYCGKSFAYSHVLSSHVMIHTGEKRYQCEVCEKKFTKSHHLKAHMNIHLRAKGEPVPKAKPRKSAASQVQKITPIGKFGDSPPEDGQYFQSVIYMNKGDDEDGTIIEQTDDQDETEEAQHILIIQEN